MKTKVIYLYHVENEDLFAYFPNEIADIGQNRMSYSHVGQHSSCCQEYASDCRLATPKEYHDLNAELEGIGYDLDVIEIPQPVLYETDFVLLKNGHRVEALDIIYAEESLDEIIVDRNYGEKLVRMTDLSEYLKNLYIQHFIKVALDEIIYAKVNTIEEIINSK